MSPAFYNLGAIAQLARALEWHSRGRGFDSHWLHHPITKKPSRIICWAFLLLIALSI